MKPAPQRLALANGTRLASQQKKRCLERILRILGVSQDVPVGMAWLEAVREYERDVLSKRQ